MIRQNQPVLDRTKTRRGGAASLVEPPGVRQTWCNEPALIGRGEAQYSGTTLTRNAGSRGVRHHTPIMTQRPAGWQEG